MYDVTILGCGVIGASLAYRLAQYDLKVLVLERENDIAMGTTKANSAIVHAGYDPEHGTLMARLNVEGSAMMEELCCTLSVEYRRIGSFVLAFGAEDEQHLRGLYENGKKNGVPDLQMLTGDEARQMDAQLAPEVSAALYAPSAAIIDPWGLCLAEAETAVRNGATIKLQSEVTAIEDQGEHYILHTTSGDYETRFVANCTGVHSQDISAMVGTPEWTSQPTRGEYYLLDKSSGELVQHVIFQCPSAAGKGVLVSPTVHGNLIVGPNAVATANMDDHRTTREGLLSVAEASRKSVPAIDLRQSIRNFAGVRAIISEPDFVIRPAKSSPRLLHVAGIKSPGLSAAPAIAKYAAEQLEHMGLSLTPRADFDGTREQIRFRKLPHEQQAALIQKDARYGRVICRCETITEGEIVQAIHSPIPPCSVDGIKRRAGAGMGRCQGGFCGPRVLEILSRETGASPLSIPKDGTGTQILLCKTKGGAQL